MQKKSSVMIVRSHEDKKLAFPVFHLSDSPLSVCQEIKYLGHIFTDNLHDDRDIYRQCRKLYAQANMLLRRFSICVLNLSNVHFLKHSVLLCIQLSYGALTRKVA